MMNIFDINKKLKQRPPFQMIEKVIELVPNESARGTKCVSVNEPFFAGHFPDTPIMPGVLIQECCAQLCSLVMEDDSAVQDPDKFYVLLKVNEFKFVKPVIPGDMLDITVTKTRAGGTLITFDAVVKVGEATYAKGTLTFTSMSKAMIEQAGK